MSDEKTTLPPAPEVPAAPPPLDTSDLPKAPPPVEIANIQKGRQHHAQNLYKLARTAAQRYSACVEKALRDGKEPPRFDDTDAGEIAVALAQLGANGHLKG